MKRPFISNTDRKPIFSQDLFTHISQMRQGDFVRQTESFFAMTKCWAKDKRQYKREFIAGSSSAAEAIKDKNRMERAIAAVLGTNVHNVVTPPVNVVTPPVDPVAAEEVSVLAEMIKKKVFAGETLRNAVAEVHRRELECGLTQTDFRDDCPEYYLDLVPKNQDNLSAEVPDFENHLSYMLKDLEQVQPTDIPLPNGLIENIPNGFIENIPIGFVENGSHFSQGLALLIVCKQIHSCAGLGVAIYGAIVRKKTDD